MKLHRFLAGLAAFAAIGLFAPAGALAQSAPPSAKKKEETKRVHKVVFEEKSNLNDEQTRSLEILQKMFAKLSGYSGEVPEDAIEKFRNTVHGALSGLHEPPRKNSADLADRLMAALREQLLSSENAHTVVKETAEVLGEDELSKESLDGLIADFRKLFARSRLSAEQADELRNEVDKLIRASTRNDERQKEREEAKEKEKKKEEEKKKKEIEEAKRKAKAKAGGSGRSSRRGSSGGSSSSGEGSRRGRG